MGPLAAEPALDERDDNIEAAGAGEIFASGVFFTASDIARSFPSPTAWYSLACREERTMVGRARILLTIAACALTTPVAAQAPGPTIAFDGKYVGTATITRDEGAFCGAIPWVDMTIAGGQAVIHEIFFNGFRQTYRGSVNAAGEVSTQFEWKWYVGGPTVDTLNGAIRDKVFTGLNMHGSYCHWHVQMSPMPPPTMPFDGDYIGISRKSNGSGAECPQSGVPAELIIRNSIVLGFWHGSVSSQGAMVIRNLLFSRLDAQTGPDGAIKGQYADSACTVIFVWRKQSG